MSVLYTNISENAERVVDPISQQVIYALLRKLGVQELFKENIHYKNDRSASSIYTRPDGTIYTAAMDRVDIVVDTKYNPWSDQLFENRNTGFNTPLNGMSNRSKVNRRAIFEDVPIGFYVRELNMPFTIAFEITFRFTEYDGAAMCLSNILNISKDGYTNEVHDIVYSYPFDVTAWNVICEVFKRRKTYRQAHPNDKVLDWLDTLSKAQWGMDIRRPDLTETAVAKGDTEYAVTRQQMSCAARLECSSNKPEPVMDNQMPIAYTLTCSYQIQFGRPHLLEFEIPPVVEQIPMSPIFFTPAYATDDPRLYGESNEPTMTKVMWDAVNGVNTRVVLNKLPNYDTWFTPYGSMIRQCKFLPVIEAVVTVDEIGKPTEVDLNQLGDIQIAPWVLEILGTMSRNDLVTYNGIFNITFFADDLPLEHRFVEWDPEKKIVSFTGQKVETVYRMVFSEASVLDDIDVKWKDTLIKYRQYLPCALMRTMGYLSQVGVLYILGDSTFRAYVNKCLIDGSLAVIIDAMIKQGATSRLRTYQTDVLGFTKYICNTPWLNRAYTLYDLFIHTAKTLGYLTNNDSFGRTINIDGSYNYDFTVGGLPNGHNEPLRVFDTNLPKLK